MKQREFGKTGIQVSEIGLGTWPLGGGGYGEVDPERAQAVIRAYIEKGGNFIDSARGYNRSESLIGAVLRDIGGRDKLFISSKTPKLDEQEIRDHLHTTLQELRTDYVDLFYLHQPPWEDEKIEQTLDIYEKLKEEGKIRFIGASVKGPNVTDNTVSLCKKYIDTGRVDALQIIYSMVRQKNSEMFSYAAEKGVALISRTSLENGFLTSKYSPDHRFPEGDHRGRWPVERVQRILAQVRTIESQVLKPPFENLVQTALRFVLDNTYITTVIPGAKSMEQLVNNLKPSDLPSLSDEMHKQLETISREYGMEFNATA